MKISFSLFCVLTFTALYAAATESQNTPSAEVLVDRLSSALEAAFNFIEDYEQTTKFSYRLGPSRDSGTSFERGHIRHDGQCAYHRLYKWGDFNLKLRDLPPDQPYYHCLIKDKKNRTYYHNNMHLKEPNRPGFVSHQPLQTNETALLNTQFGAAYMMGYIGSNRRLDTILRNTDRVSVRSKPETIDDVDCYVLDAETEYGRYAIWLDPEHSYLPVRIYQKESQGDISYGHRLAKGQSGVHYLKNVRFEQIDQTWVPIQADAGCNRRTVEGDFVKEDYHYKRMRIVLKPDHEKNGSFADPLFENPANDPQLTNGTRVRINHDRKEYIWQDGTLIPLVEKD